MVFGALSVFSSLLLPFLAPVFCCAAFSWVCVFWGFFAVAFFSKWEGVTRGLWPLKASLLILLLWVKRIIFKLPSMGGGGGSLWFCLSKWRAWSRFCKSKSSNWCDQIRQGSSIFLLEAKRNRGGKFLQLSAINRGRPSFIIFPGGWKGQGWSRIFEVLVEIVDPSFVHSRGIQNAPYEEMFPVLQPPHSHPIPPPPPPPGCCPRCGFFGEPASFLRSFARVTSKETPFDVEDVPIVHGTSKEVHFSSKAKGKH